VVTEFASATAAPHAYGAAVTSVRGDRVSNAPPPVGRIAISSHWRSPANCAAPKSSGTANRPPFTATALRLSMLPIGLPPACAL